MKYQKPYKWKSKKIYGENEGWMGKSIGKYRTDDSDDPFFNDFFTLQIFAWKVASERKKLPKFFKNQFFHSFLPKFYLFSFIFPPSHSIFSSKSLFFFLRLDFATLNLPTGGRSSVPLTPLNGHSHSLVPMFPFLFFLVYLLRFFINNFIFIENFHK